MKHKPLKCPKNRKQLAKQLDWLAENMMDIATSIDYFGGFAPWAAHGKELAGAAMICREWAVEIAEDKRQ